ncbi:hypothetical protein EPUS_09122 [Endocarpon pusillum Z07020]|uniref:Protein kinase domain-containing protein n=1 Tax=Endocarpon pusillum (strain Z07020 / HMAS-L-300199) TaxID=1263415 RepID=U1HUZ1_ENDPU|nr:uncharacterized protein EPUS_09122 [Endocarpon pusillum Z07020]ERF73124.1 hypothetical protein EPUS_09122 [Endocarpon pusillum Z07020]
MDIFQTIVTSGELIYHFLDAYSAHSKEARSLAARFKWDIRVLQQIVQHFDSRRLQNEGKLTEPDQKLLQETAEYLQSLAARAGASCARVQTQEWLSRASSKVLWFHRRKELQSLEQELFEWTSRFDIRLVGLPPELKTIISSISEEQDDAGSSKALCSNRRMHRVQALAEEARLAESRDLFLENVPKTLRKTHLRTGSEYSILEFKSEQVILESRYFALASDSGPRQIRVLTQCHRQWHPERPSFNLIHSLPFPPSPATATTLKSLVAAQSGSRRMPPLHSLDQRYRVALHLSTAVLFLHGSDYLHKNISSESVLMLFNDQNDSSLKFPYALGKPYLVNFELIRSFALGSHPMEPSSDWKARIYIHPARQDPRPRSFIKSYDIYSLGVVLLELGLWRPLERFDAELSAADPDEMQKALNRIAQELGITMGKRYREIVQWCLALYGDQDVQPAVLVREVLSKLEDIVEAIG